MVEFNWPENVGLENCRGIFVLRFFFCLRSPPDEPATPVPFPFFRLRAVSVSVREFNLRRNGFHYRKNHCRPSRSRGDGTWTLSSELQHGKSSSTCEQEKIVSPKKRVTASTVRLTGNGKGQIASAGKLGWSTKNRDNWNKET